MKRDACFYCSEYKDDNRWNGIFQDSLTGDWYIHHRTSEWDAVDGNFIYDKIYINYCPWCGKKLKNKRSRINE